VWLLMLRPATMLYVLHGLLDFPILKNRRSPIIEGESGTGWVRLFHLVPFARWSINVHTVDADARVIATEECGGVFRRWTHTLHVEPIDALSCRYTDIVDLERALSRLSQFKWWTRSSGIAIAGGGDSRPPSHQLGVRRLPPPLNRVCPVNRTVP
jgi:hypothetical protein